MKIESKKIGVGLVGFGTVGQGVAELLTDSQSPIAAKTGVQPELLRICDVDLGRVRDVDVDEKLLTSRLEDILEDQDIGVGIELIGGIKTAKTVIEKLLRAGKHVVTANKALLASQGTELFELAGSLGKQIRFEASCAGGIPLIGALENGLVANRIAGLKGIVNGTCNYILTCMYQKNESFASALDQAKKAGYAEADPTLDINGMGAGRGPTASAVVADLVELARNPNGQRSQALNKWTRRDGQNLRCVGRKRHQPFGDSPARKRTDQTGAGGHYDPYGTRRLRARNAGGNWEAGGRFRGAGVHSSRRRKCIAISY